MLPAASTWTDARLEPTRFGAVQWFTAVDSTNRVLLDAAARGAAEGAVAVADEQTAGRGRLGRTWVAPPAASLLVSVLLRPRVEPERLGLVTMAAGVAAIAAVGRVARIAARLKWPNDLVVDDRKLAGILAEKDGDAVVVGMGLNVAWDAFPPDIAATATACNLLTPAPVAREELLVAWLVELDRRLDALDATIDETRTHSATIGRRVRVELVRETFEADAIGITDSGLLVVRRDDGRELALSAGDVVHLRADD
jgi:BirA family biotin operon repressor/biotin-[acetyl-CoA-carboxylase] ligase